MKTEDSPESEPGTLGGTLRMLAALGVLALLALGLLLLLDVIPGSVVSETVARVLGVLALLAAGAFALAWLMRARR